jgi:hypothetical protein
MAYFDTKKGSLEEAIKASVGGQIAETNKNNKSDDGEGMDAVQPKAVKKKFADRKDKDLDNDGDTDASDKYLHKRRKAVSKAIKSDESFEYGTPEATENSLNMTPGQSSKEWDEQVGIMHKKQNTMRETVAKMWGVEEGHNPFKKEEVKTSKKEGKTMTGKSETKVTIGMKDK